MDSVTYVRIGVLAAAAATLLAACTGSGSREADLPDSALLTVPADPAATPQPAQAESARTSRETPARSSSTPVPPATPSRTRPPLTPPSEARDIRPSIPYPPDTLTPIRRDPPSTTP